MFCVITPATSTHSMYGAGAVERSRVGLATCMELTKAYTPRAAGLKTYVCVSWVGTRCIVRDRLCRDATLVGGKVLDALSASAASIARRVVWNRPHPPDPSSSETLMRYVHGRAGAAYLAQSESEPVTRNLSLSILRHPFLRVAADEESGDVAVMQYHILIKIMYVTM